MSKQLVLITCLLFGVSDVVFGQEVRGTMPQEFSVEEEEGLLIFEVPVPYDEEFASNQLPKVVRPENGDVPSEVKLPSGEIVPIEKIRMKTVSAWNGRRRGPLDDQIRHKYPGIGFQFSGEFQGRSTLSIASIGLSKNSTNLRMCEFYGQPALLLGSLRLGQVIPCGVDGLYCYNRTRDRCCLAYLEYLPRALWGDSIEPVAGDHWAIPLSATLRFPHRIKPSEPYELWSIILRNLAEKTNDDGGKDWVATIAITETRITNLEKLDVPSNKLLPKDFQTKKRVVEVKVGDFLEFEGRRHEVRAIVRRQEFDKTYQVEDKGEEKQVTAFTYGWIEICAVPEGE